VVLRQFRNSKDDGKGGKVREQIVGYVPKETIQKALDKHISG
jgi:hypothetical protein